MISFLALFGVCFKIGLFTFGGGQAMIPLLQKDLVARLGWITMKEFLDFVAISQVTPGPIAVNMATFVGYTQAGILGSVLATLGVSIPAVAVIIVIAVFFPDFKDNVWVQRFFAGVIVGVAAQIATIVLDLGKRQKWTIVSAAVCAAALGILFFVHQVSPIWLILGGGLVGIAVEAARPRKPAAAKRAS